jgi:hypothetical protein
VDDGLPSSSDDREGGPDTRRTGPYQESWPADVTRRLRVLLHTLPLDALRRGDNLRDAELRHYDGLALALRILDVVIDRLGLEDEADSDVVTRALEPVLVAMDEAAGSNPTPQGHEAIVDKILGSLRNDSDARRPFREEYGALDGLGRAGRHAVEFRLLSDAFHPSGRTVLRPSNEACNLYLRLLDLDIEDAQAAAEAVVESQLARGRFDEAVHSARQARIQSVRFREKVVGILRDTRRDVERVDWKVDVPRTLNDVRTHLEHRLRVESGILNTADERLDTLPEPEDDARRAVARVAELVQECRLRHTELHEHLMQARNVFLEAQARQSFAARPTQPLPDLVDDVLERILELPVRVAEPLLGRGFPLFVGARPPAALTLSDLVRWMLQPRRPRPRREVPVDPVDPAVIEAELQRYPPAVRAYAAEMLERLHTPARLSQVLQNARAAGADASVCEILALLALQGFATEDRRAAGAVSEQDGTSLEDPEFYGDDLLVVTWKRADGR